jgi:hypothetical protein
MPNEQRHVPIDEDDLEDFFDDFFEDAGLSLGAVRFRIKDVDIDHDGSVQVDFAIKTAPRFQDEVGDALNLVNRALDGRAGAGNPAINFNDENPATPEVTDTFRLQFTPGSGFDFIDI